MDKYEIAFQLTLKSADDGVLKSKSSTTSENALKYNRESLCETFNYFVENLKIDAVH